MAEYKSFLHRASAQPGKLHFFLNAHTPYIRHPKGKACFEECWLFEHMAESYLPLLDMLERLAYEGIPYKMTLCISSTLLEMFDDPLLRERFVDYMKQKISLGQQEIKRTTGQIQTLAAMYMEAAQRTLHLYEKIYQCNPLGRFRTLAQRGFIELVASTATSPFLPLLEPHKIASAVQVKVGLDVFEKKFGFPSAGFWLNECGYRLNDDAILANFGLKYFISDPRSVLSAAPRPENATFLPVRSVAGLTVLPCDLESQLELTSSRTGYYTAAENRGFYHDLSDDFPDLTLGSFTPKPDQRASTGYKYYRITGPTDHKELYSAEEGRQTAHQQALTFTENRIRQAQWLYEQLGEAPVITIALNAEFFGHHWFEGFEWLEAVIRRIAAQPRELQLLTGCQASGGPDKEWQTCEIEGGSWSDGGFGARWFTPANDWVSKHINLAGSRLIKMMRAALAMDDDWKRLIRQAIRELLLAESADWPLMLSTGQNADLARRKVRNHLVSFYKLYDDFREGRFDEDNLRKLELRYPLFEQIDFKECLTDLRGFNLDKGRKSPVTDSQANDMSTIVAHLQKLQTTARTLCELCKESVSIPDPQKKLTITKKLPQKAAESVALVEKLAELSQNPELLTSYKAATAKLETAINEVLAADSQEDVHRIGSQTLLPAAAEWTKAVDELMKNLIDSAQV